MASISSVQLDSYAAPMSSLTSGDEDNKPSPSSKVDIEKGVADVPAMPDEEQSRLNTSEDKWTLSLLFVLFVVSIPISIVCFDRVMHVGYPTPFPSSDERAAFTPGPTSRGTINIVWACLTTIFTCVYVPLHVDIPRYEDEGRVKTLRRKLGWMVINAVSPELIAYVAIVELLSARRWTKRIRNILLEFERKKLLASEEKKLLKSEAEEKKLLESEVKKWTLTHTFFADMGGFKVRLVDKDGHCKSEVVMPTAGTLWLWLCQNPLAANHIDLKQIASDIDDKRKADWLAKILTVIQASWLVVQSIVRAAKNQPVSELEVTTCAYVASALSAYICWWYKPYDAQKHILLPVPDSIEQPRVIGSHVTPFNKLAGLNDMSGRMDLIATTTSGCIGAIVGAIHCTLWNAKFANSNGQLLWRICSITQIATSFLMSFFLALASIKERPYLQYAQVRSDLPTSNILPHKFLLTMVFFACFIQFCARIVIFILIGYSFWSLPKDVYRTTDWTWSWFPHVG